MMRLISCFVFSIFVTATFGQQEAIIESGNSKLFYRTFGSGDPLLIINGGPGMNSDGFVSLAKSLAKNNMIIIYDQRGTGRSTLQNVDTTTITMRLMANDIENLRKHLNINSWVLLGHSFGGMLASYYTSIYPGRVKALILSSSGGLDLGLLSYVGKMINSKLNKQQRDSVDYWTKEMSNGDTSYFAKYGRGKFLANAYVYNKKNVPVIAERLTQSNHKVNDLVWQNLQKIKFDCITRLRSFKKPVLIIQGKEDIVTMQTALQEKKTFQHAKLVILDNCVHYGWLDAPEKYFFEVESFLKSN